MVYDCFSFFSEFDLLELRLNYLDPIVDFFVISEAPIMFSGLPKPLYFEEHKNEPRFKKFEHKIIHQILTDIPNDYINLSITDGEDPFHELVIEKTLAGDWWPHNHPPYGRDTFSKESLIRPLTDCQNDDIIILGDADEIPNKETLKLVIEEFKKDPYQIYNLAQKMYNYYLNCQKVDSPEEVWFGNIILSFEKFKKNSFCEMKVRRRGFMVSDGGWHFSYLGDREKSLEKMIAGNETAMYTDHIKANIQKNIDECFTSTHDVYFRPCRFVKTEVDETYPDYILQNLETYGKYIAL